MNLNVEMPKTFPNVLTSELFKRVKDDVESNGWIFKNRSYDGDTILSWTQKRNDRSIILEAGNYIKGVIEKYLDDKFTLMRIHFNGQTYGQNGKSHQDYYIPGIVTFILYVNEDWEYEWGGETYVIDDKNKLTINPVIPNSGILIPAFWYHWGNAPTVTNKLRITIAFSYCLEEIFDTVKENLEILID